MSETMEKITKALQHAKADIAAAIPYISIEGTPYGLLQTQKLIDDAIAALSFLTASPHGGTGEALKECADDCEHLLNILVGRAEQEWDYEYQVQRIARFRAALTASPHGGTGEARYSDEQWKRAIDCAASQFESYVRRNELSTMEQRRAALDDAFQHAYGLLSLALHASQAPDGEGWREISAAPKDGQPIEFRQSSTHYVLYRDDMKLADEPYRMRGEPKLEWRPWSAAAPSPKGEK